MRYLFHYFTGKNKQRIGVQLQEAREKFSHIAGNHAEALQVTYFLFQYCTLLDTKPVSLVRVNVIDRFNSVLPFELTNYISITTMRLVSSNGEAEKLI